MFFFPLNSNSISFFIVISKPFTDSGFYHPSRHPQAWSSPSDCDVASEHAFKAAGYPDAEVTLPSVWPESTGVEPVCDCLAQPSKHETCSVILKFLRQKPS